jgi:hypothetical protein
MMSCIVHESYRPTALLGMYTAAVSWSARVPLAPTGFVDDGRHDVQHQGLLIVSTVSKKSIPFYWSIDLARVEEGSAYGRRIEGSSGLLAPWSSAD